MSPIIPRCALMLCLLLGVTACSLSTGSEGPDDCEHWSIGVVAPKHMEAWAEAVYVKDVQDRWVRMAAGVVGELGETEGWDSGRWLADRDSNPQADAPKEIYIRWQSLVEPQAYYWHFEVPETMRQQLVKREPAVWQGRAERVCRSNIAVGVAPGGRTVVWLAGGGLPRVEIQRGQAIVVPEGPDLGRFGGRYVRMDDKTKQYLETHRIPYGSW
ncbi:DUF2931 family protein [Dyella sp. ASV21]|uniref:DUF2931 family protein n=1 Tax=Dyella sp. ASV21 TaxID=2795114 RepID=UPI0018ECC78E|nr:DUF2931 family protein [Dyella sp. ASV21]